jgi:hypothetical protein
MEQVLPPQTQRSAGFEPARVRQFTVFLENRVGRLQSLLGAIELPGLLVRAIALEESGESTLVRLIFSDSEAAKKILQDAAFPFGELDVIAVQTSESNPKPLGSISTVLLTAEINIHYLYSFLAAPKGRALALYVDEPLLAAQLLIKKGFTLISESDLKS